ncbi:MAG: hypothetical protein JWM32_1507 [Verrucomicrobia bacterium]|nr:hypothetical protein [Verrucomicrobiota bacterium]
MRAECGRQKFPWTTFPFPLSFFPMEPSKEKFTSPGSLIVDAILVISFFVFMFSVLKGHVTSNDPTMITIWGLIAASCVTGVFWLALQMFRVVLRAHRAALKNKG